MTTAGRILIMPKGDYNAETEYEMLDLVRHNGTSWLCKTSCQNKEPTSANSEYWQSIFDADAFAASLDARIEAKINELLNKA